MTAHAPRAAADECFPTWHLVAVIGLVLAAAAIYFDSHWHSLTAFWISLDPVSAVNCQDGHWHTLLFCDFAKHYYPQGKEIFLSGQRVSGFLYPAPAAILMGGLAPFDYGTALTIWMTLVVLSLLGFYLLPQVGLFSDSRAATALHTFLFVAALPVIHNFIWGQLSALVSLLVLGGLVLHARGQRSWAAVAIGLATSLKVYPAIFAVYLVVERDLKSTVVFGVTCAFLLVGLPAMVLGTHGTISFYRSLIETFLEFSGLPPSQYSNGVTNALAWAQIAIDPSLRRVLNWTGYVLAISNVWLMYALSRRRVQQGPFWTASLSFTMVPLLVGTSWVHYFVYLPMVQMFLLVMTVRSRLRRAVRVCLVAAFVLPSIVLTNWVFFAAFGDPERYYTSAVVLWSSLLLIPPLYVLAGSTLLRRM